MRAHTLAHIPIKRMKILNRIQRNSGNPGTLTGAAMSTEEDEVARLKRRVSELEQELIAVRDSQPARTKIEQMSAEVVDSNPYRYMYEYRKYT